MLASRCRNAGSVRTFGNDNDDIGVTGAVGACDKQREPVDQAVIDDGAEAIGSRVTVQHRAA